jgi:hypothetical protein
MATSLALAHHLIRLPELLDIIFAHLERSDLVKLIRASRFFFFCAAASVWRDLAGITKIISLIPGAIIKSDRKNNTGMLQRHVIVSLPPHYVRHLVFDVLKF